ncbi:hypothetical protein Tco_1353649 [Tanacetum coccineum]
MQQPMQNPGDISNPTTTFDMALALMAKAFTLNDTTPTNNNQRNVHYLRSFEKEFPAIVYNDALTSKPEISSEPTITLHHVKKVDFDFEKSFFESDDDDYTVIYDKDSFSYKIISSNDLKLDMGNDNDKIDSEQSLGDLSIKPLPNAADRVVTPTPGSAITIPETANEIAIKGNHLILVKGNQFDGRTKTDPHKHIHEFLGICDMFKYSDTENEAFRLMMFPLSLTGEAKACEITQEVLNAAAGGIFLYKTPNQAYQLLEDKVLLKLDWAKNQKTKSSHKKTVAFANEGSSNSDTNKIIARMDAMTLKIDTQYKELQTHSKKMKPNIDEDDIPMSREEEAKFMQNFYKTHFYNDYRDRDSNRDNWRSNEQSSYNRDNYRSNTDDKPYDLQKQYNDFMKSQQSTNTFIKETFMDLKTQLETVAKNHQTSIQNLETKFNKLADKQSGRPSGSLPSNTQPNPKGHNSKAYKPPQSRNEHVNVVFTRSGKSYNSPVNLNDQQTNFKTPINFDSDDKDEEPTP